MSKQYKEASLDYWRTLIDECLSSDVPRDQWFKEHDITRHQFYYWNNILKQQSCKTDIEEHIPLVELPINTNEVTTTQPSKAIIKFGCVTITVDDGASTSFMENIGRLIHYAL